MRKFSTVAAFIIVAAAAYFAYNTFLTNTGGGDAMTYTQAKEKLAKLVKGINWTEDIVQRRAQIQLGQKQEWKESLPDIDQFTLPVNPMDGPDTEIVEIFASTEKSGTGTDGLLIEVADAFNRQNMTLQNGKIAKVRIRKIASGTAYEFIASGKYTPQGFSPSNQLWVDMTFAHGVTMTPIRTQWIGNIAGIVMKKSVAAALKKEYGNLDVKTLIDAVVQGKLVMGYTNPFASSTGLNFLVTVLATFADGDPAKMLSPEVISSFESFQRGVPFVALTTLQMRDSVEKDGSLDAFVMEYQTFVNTSGLKSVYEFIPFGVRHDNPLYGVGALTEGQKEVLERFADFAEQKKYKSLASKYGFNPTLKYEPRFQITDGNILIQAQKLWKEKKDAGRPIAAVFLCDISGSMAGSRIAELKQALLGGSEKIGRNNRIGLMVFNHQVSMLLPVQPFDLPHKSAFFAAVQDMDANGKTAMYDGIAVSLLLLTRAKEKDPNVKPMLFVLTDGRTNTGLKYDDLAGIVPYLQIPIYTIGYEANIAELQKISSLVEAASINASEADVRYKIEALFNAQM